MNEKKGRAQGLQIWGRNPASRVHTGLEGAPPGTCEWLALHENSVSHGPKTDVISLGLVNPLRISYPPPPTPSQGDKDTQLGSHAAHPVRDLTEAPLAHFEIRFVSGDHGCLLAVSPDCIVTH